MAPVPRTHRRVDARTPGRAHPRVANIDDLEVVHDGREAIVDTIVPLRRLGDGAEDIHVCVEESVRAEARRRQPCAPVVTGVGGERRASHLMDLRPGEGRLVVQPYRECERARCGRSDVADPSIDDRVDRPGLDIELRDEEVGLIPDAESPEVADVVGLVVLRDGVRGIHDRAVDLRDRVGHERDEFVTDHAAPRRDIGSDRERTHEDVLRRDRRIGALIDIDRRRARRRNVARVAHAEARVPRARRRRLRQGVADEEIRVAQDAHVERARFEHGGRGRRTGHSNDEEPRPGDDGADGRRIETDGERDVTDLRRIDRRRRERGKGRIGGCDQRVVGDELERHGVGRALVREDPRLEGRRDDRAAREPAQVVQDGASFLVTDVRHEARGKGCDAFEDAVQVVVLQRPEVDRGQRRHALSERLRPHAEREDEEEEREETRTRHACALAHEHLTRVDSDLCYFSGSMSFSTLRLYQSSAEYPAGSGERRASNVTARARGSAS